MSDEGVIETVELTKRFGREMAVAALNLTVKAHQITGFLGRNGAGKSTTIKMLLGMTRPTTGSATVLGYRIDNERDSCSIRRHVAYVAEDKPLYGYMTVAELIRFTRSFYEDWRRDAEQRLLLQYNLPLDRKVKALSKGMRTKLALLLALARRPRLLILDEPSEGLDPVSIEELLQSMVVAASEGTTVFFSSHQIAEVERIADRVCIVDRGRVVTDVALDRLRENYRRITAGFPVAAPTGVLPVLGVEQMRVSGRQITVLASRGADQIAEHLRSLGAVSIDVEPATLREVFLETVQGAAGAVA
jgi:ABC-2 type transport system ATP-binding protein